MEKGNVAFFIDKFNNQNTGVLTSVSQLVIILKTYFDIDIFCSSFDNNLEYKSFENIFFSNKKYVWNFSTLFTKNFLPKYDVVHIHGVWMYPQYIGAKLAIKYNIPFVFTPHGMLEPWLMQVSHIGIFKYIKKNFYFKFIALPIFKKAVYIHAITPLEKKNLSQYFPKNKIVVIPNAVDVEKIRKFIRYQQKGNLKKRILFIGRLHPIKGIELLIKAFIQGEFFKKNWELWIVGPEEVPEYVKSLKKLSNGLETFIKFTGPIFDNRKKFELYFTSWITVVPSYSEVVGMVNLESASCYTPTITTYATGLLDWEKGGNILIHPNVEDLKKALCKTTTWSLEERLQRGKKSFDLVKNKYSKETVKKQWTNLYKSIS